MKKVKFYPISLERVEENFNSISLEGVKYIHKLVNEYNLLVMKIK